jgi:hypothetical protein
VGIQDNAALLVLVLQQARAVEPRLRKTLQQRNPDAR